MSRAWVVVFGALGAATLSGCPKQIPSVGFSGASVKAVQPNLADRSLRLDLELDFVVRNPLPRRLVVPAHECRLTLGGGPVERVSLGETVVEAGQTRVFPYRFALLLSGPGARAALQPLLGRDVPYTFEAESAVDLPDWVMKEVDAPPADASGVKKVAALLPAELRAGKITFTHEGTLRLPLLPVLSRSGAAQPRVELIGGAIAPGPDPSVALAQLRAALQPFVDTLQRWLDTRPPSRLTISVTQVFGLLGIGSDKVQIARRALQTAGFGVPGPDAQVALPIQPPSPMEALKQMEPRAQERWAGFKTAYGKFDPSRFAGPGMPARWPAGVRVTVPFRLTNPNTFDVRLPGLRLNAVRPEDGAVVSAVRAEKLGGGGAATPEGVVIRGGQSVEMALTSELRWDQLGGLLAQLQSGGGPLPPRLLGEISLDVGLGQLTVPIDL